MPVYLHKGEFLLETGGVLRDIHIQYHTYGTMNDGATNVVWICHALTANSDVADWWPGMVGKDKALTPSKYFIVCANILGSCYGTTGPLDNEPATGKAYLKNFPFITVRDLVKAHIALRNHLKIPGIFLLVGGSLGGYQALEWSLMEPKVIRNLFLLTTSAAESAWGIAIHEAQRLALLADDSFKNNETGGGSAGVKAARAIGILTYRNYNIMVQKQTDPDKEKTNGFRAAAYIDHQGNKLASRFNAYSYWTLSKTMDSHNISRQRNGEIEQVLHTIYQPALIIGISSDLLCPAAEQKHLAQHMPQSKYVEIDSAYGHDGFLVESEKIKPHLEQFILQIKK